MALLAATLQAPGYASMPLVRGRGLATLAGPADLAVWNRLHSLPPSRHCAQVNGEKAPTGRRGRRCRREVFRLVTRESDTRQGATLAEAPDRRSTIDERLDAVENRADLARALDGLDGVKSAAEALGMPEGTAKLRLHRIHKKLSSALQNNDR